MQGTRRRFIAGAAAVAVTGSFSGWGLTAARVKSPFRLAVINDEISQDFDHACHVAANEFGLEWIELRGMWNKNVINLDEREIAEAKRILAKYNLRVTDIASPLFKTAWPHGALAKSVSRRIPGPDQFGAGFDAIHQDEVLQRSIALAQQFGTERVRCFDFLRLEDPAPYRKEINEVLRKAALACYAHNLKLVLENEMSCNTATGQEAAATLAAIPTPSLMLNWDPGNAAAAGEIPYPDGYDLLAKNRMGHCHCKDVKRSADGTFAWEAVGGGTVNWVGQLRALKQQGYRLGVSLETHWRGAGTPEASTRASMAGLRKDLRAAGALG
jgi:sugar phosphate isomerase/epimerase